MSTPGQRPGSSKAGRTGPRRGGAGTKVPTRAQIRDMEARAMATRVAARDEMAERVEAPTRPADRLSAAERPVRGRTRVVTRPVTLTREEEYRAIRSDLNRLLVTAGSLLAVMLLLLVVIEG